MTGLEIIGAIGALSAFLSVLQNEGNIASQVESNALKELNKAVSRTEGYFSRDVMNRNLDEAKYELSELWNNASIACADAGYEKMQRLCQIKGVYWLNPTNWTDEEIEASGIQLAEMRKKLDIALAD